MSKNRIAAVAGRPLSSFSWFTPYLILPFHPRSVKSAWRYIGTVGKDFVALQFFEKWGWKHIPVVNVQTPLDDKIPFTPERISIYLHFVNFWLQPITMLMKRYGVRKSLPFCIEYLDRIQLAYSEAARVYTFRLSTTNRPDYNKTKAFRNIHRLDPHYLCVPSLHISIVVLTYTYFRSLFEREHFTEEEKTQWNAELYKEAVAIAESVLYVKQHSVNCVPAALYMMTRITPDLVTSADVVQFINDMFAHADDMSAEVRKEVNEYIQYMYERLLLEGVNEADWTNPVKHWLLEYAHKTGQTQAY